MDDGGSGSYGDLINLRKQLISDNVIQIDVAKNLKSAESILSSPLLENIQALTHFFHACEED